MNYKMKNIGATVSLYKIAGEFDTEFLNEIGFNRYDLEFLFIEEAKEGCDYLDKGICQYGDSKLNCLIKTCPLGSLVEEEFRTIANNLESPFTEPGEEMFEGEE